MFKLPPGIYWDLEQAERGRQKCLWASQVSGKDPGQPEMPAKLEVWPQAEACKTCR